MLKYWLNWQKQVPLQRLMFRDILQPDALSEESEKLVLNTIYLLKCFYWKYAADELKKNINLYESPVILKFAKFETLVVQNVNFTLLKINFSWSKLSMYTNNDILITPLYAPPPFPSMFTREVVKPQYTWWSKKPIKKSIKTSPVLPDLLCTPTNRRMCLNRPIFHFWLCSILEIARKTYQLSYFLRV